MRTARLFTIGAVAAFVVAFLSRFGMLRGTLGIDLFSMVVGPFYWESFVAVICAAMALSYFAVARTVARPPNQALGTISFILVAAALLVMVAANWTSNLATRRFESLVWLLFAAMFAFLVGVVLSAVNLAWAVFRQAVPASN